MNEGVLLQRYGIFVVLAVLLHTALFLGPSGEFSKAQLELHAGARAVRLRLVNAMPRETVQPASAAAKAQELVPASTPAKAPAAPAVEAARAVPSLRDAEAAAPVARIEEKPSAIPPVASDAFESALSNTAEVREAEVVERAASSVAPTVEPARETSNVASSPLASAVPPGVEIEARAMSGRTPEYPQRSVLRSEEGRVVVRLEVDTQGRAHQIEVVEGSGHFRLDRSVLRFVREERFVPAQRGDTPIASTQTFSFRFELRDAPR